MSRAAYALRNALEQFWSGEHEARLLRLRDPSDDEVPRSRAQGRWLLSEAAEEALQDARRAGELNENEAAWIARHRDAVRHLLARLGPQAKLREQLARAELASGEPMRLRETLGRLASGDDEKRRATVARELDQALRPHAHALVALHARAEEPLQVARELPKRAEAPERVSPGGLLIVSAFDPTAMEEAARRDLPNADWLTHAASFLSQTDAAAEEGVQHLVRAFGSAKPLPWHRLLRGLRAPELDSESGKQQRWRRVAQVFRALGFERELATMRAEPDREGVLPIARTLVRAVPRDVRSAQIALDFGVASDALAAEGVGRTLGLCLVHGALPIELRMPTTIDAQAAGALAGLALQLWGEREQQRRMQGLTEIAAERVSRVASTLTLLRARVACAVALAPLGDVNGTGARLEALAEALGSALVCDLPLGLVAVLGADRVRARVLAQELLAGLALHGALRERYDEDWYRNPRSAELLRAACARGNGHSPSALCEELSTSFAAAAGRAQELLS